MSYVLEAREEANRLESQAEIPQYSLRRELESITLYEKDRVLDAGCGSGLLCRYLAKNYNDLIIDGVDFSDLRIKQAQNILKGTSSEKLINYSRANLESLEVENNTYDHIISRYVFEHLLEPQVVSDELFRVCKPNGKITIIDFDGIFINLFSHNQRFNELFNIVKSSFKSDLNIGRRLPYILKQSGFERIKYNIESIYFSGVDAEKELINNKQRCENCRDIFLEALKDKSLVNEFIELYLEESMKEENVLYFNKFIVSGTKVAK
jgi:ubiquinone/menaquinone biosynthesis C-methylase UbiE